MRISIIDIVIVIVVVLDVVVVVVVGSPNLESAQADSRD